MRKLHCRPQNYDWGKVGEDSLVYQLLCASGEKIENSNQPFAELWIGDHDKAPSYLDENGTRLSQGGYGQIPFLFKILSIRRPLSIQLHPNLEQAKELYNDGNSIYPDANHKPEMGLFVKNTELLFGFREYHEIVENLKTFKSLYDVCSPASQSFIESPTPENLRNVLYALLTRPNDQIKVLTEELHKESDKIQNKQIYEHIRSSFPGDKGIFFMFLLNVLKGEQGTAVFIPTGILHSYLSGDLYEAMAVSDNVIRAGMTPKLVDVESLIRFTDFTPQKPYVVTPECIGPLKVYRPPAPISEFLLKTLHLRTGHEYDLEIASTTIALIEHGSALIEGTKVQKGSIQVLKAGNYHISANVEEVFIILCHENDLKYVSN